MNYLLQSANEGTVLRHKLHTPQSSASPLLRHQFCCFFTWRSK